MMEPSLLRALLVGDTTPSADQSQDVGINIRVKKCIVEDTDKDVFCVSCRTFVLEKEFTYHINSSSHRTMSTKMDMEMSTKRSSVNIIEDEEEERRKRRKCENVNGGPAAGNKFLRACDSDSEPSNNHSLKIPNLKAVQNSMKCSLALWSMGIVSSDTQLTKKLSDMVLEHAKMVDSVLQASDITNKSRLRSDCHAAFVLLSQVLLNDHFRRSVGTTALLQDLMSHLKQFPDAAR